VMDLTPYKEYDASCLGFKRVFINAHILEKDGTEEIMDEGCLSVPTIHEKIPRLSRIHIQYLDENFQAHDEIFEGHKARVIQHEYDHLEGILFVDRLIGIRKQMIRSKLNKIMTGKITCSYKVKIP